MTVGTAFDITLNLYNATSRRADNVVVSLGQSAAAAGATAAGGLTVLGTGNAKYLGTLKGKTEGTVTFRVIAGPGTPPGALTVPVTVSFEHQDARQEVAYTHRVLVSSETRLLSLVTAELPNTAMVGEMFDASFEVANASGYALSGVTLSVEASERDRHRRNALPRHDGCRNHRGTRRDDHARRPGRPRDRARGVSYRDDFGRAGVPRVAHRDRRGDARAEAGEEGAEA